MSHATSQLTGTGSIPATINPAVTGNLISGNGLAAHISLVGPMRMSGVDYGLKSVEYCIEGSGVITSATVYAMQPAGIVASDGTDRSAAGCYTVTVNHSTAKAYDFVWQLSGASSVRVTGVRSTWAPASTLPAPLTTDEVGDPAVTG